MTSAAALALLLSCCVSPAQIGDSAFPGETKDPCTKVTIPISVASSKPGTPFQASDLIAELAGNTLHAVSLSASQVEPRIVLLVDTSGSMAPDLDDRKLGTRAWGHGLEASVFAFRALPENAKVAFGTFASHLHIAPFGNLSAAQQQLSDLAKVTPRGETDLFGSLHIVAQAFGTPQFGDAIYVVTDGGDNRAKVSARAVSKELAFFSVRVYVFFITHQKFVTPDEKEGLDNIQLLAENTGGQIVQMPWSEDWLATTQAENYAALIRQYVRAPYRLELLLDRPLSKPGKLKITSSQPTLHLIYPKLLVPCAGH